MPRGLFITFEGGDGSGKSTQIEKLAAALKELGHEVLLTREPGGTRISESIREILLDNDNKAMSPMTETMLYAAARAQTTMSCFFMPQVYQKKACRGSCCAQWPSYTPMST